MAGPSSPDPHSRNAQPDADALNDRASEDAALGRTLEAELTRAAKRANPASLTPSDPSAPAAAGAPSTPSAPPPAESAGGSTSELDLNLIAADTGAEAATSGEAQAASEDPDADDAQSGASRRPRIGWGGVLALLNVVLSGFILMLWGVPRWDVGRAAAQAGGVGAARANTPGGRNGGGAGAVAGGTANGASSAASGAGTVAAGVTSPSASSAAGAAGIERGRGLQWSVAIRAAPWRHEGWRPRRRLVER